MANKAQFKDKFVVENGTHNDTWYVDLENYLKKLDGFMKKANL